MKILKKMTNQTKMLSVLMIFLAAAPLLMLPTVQSQATRSSDPGYAPTWVGSASRILLSGPMTLTPSWSTLLTPTISVPPSVSTPKFQMPYPSKPRAGTAPAATPANAPIVPAVVSCPGPSCDAVSISAGGATTQRMGLNAYDSGTSYGIDVEPGDFGLCSGNGYLMEYTNIGELRLFKPATLTPGLYITLDKLMGLTTLGWSSGGDEAGCLYDYDNGGHWFVTEAVSKTSWAVLGPFGGCFAGVLDTCLLGIAVSVTDNPTGAWNIYFLDPDKVNSDPGKGYLLNDFGHIGNTRDALLLTYDEFNMGCYLNIIKCPTGYGQYGFNGAQAFAFNKNALELGLSTSSPSFNVAYENMGTNPTLYPIPANPPFQPSAASCFSGPYAGAVCWYAVIPAQSPDPTQYDNSYMGSGFMVGGLDYIGLGDNRIADFYWTGLSYLLSSGCSTCSGITFGHQIMTRLEAYYDEGAACPASLGGICGLGEQEAGPIPLGDHCGEFISGAKTLTCPEDGIATDGDFFTQVSYARQQLWGTIPTLITQTYTSPPGSEIHVGAAYWVVGTSTFDTTGTFTLTGQGYVTAMHEDLEMPAIGAGGASAVMVFTLSGPNYYPSTAFGEFTATSSGLSPGTIHIADLGMAPQDGFTEYQGYPPAATRPRWGDYNWAVYVPSTDTVYFGSGYIQSAACSNFVSNPTCGGTRDPFANWGTSVNSITP